MRKRLHLKRAVCGAAAIALASCSAGEQPTGAQVEGQSAEFTEIVADARGEMRDGNLQDAARLLDEARAIEPKNPELWVQIARLRFRGGEHLQAVEAANLALEYGPQYAPALFMRAQLMRDSNGLAEALPWYESAVQADPKNPEILADYAATLGDLGRHQDMLQVVRELQKIAKGYPQVYYLQAVLAARGGKPVLARSLLAKSGLFQREVPSALLLDAIIDIQQQSYDTAANTLTRLSQRQPGNARAKELLARALWLGGRDDELINRFGGVATAVDTSPYLTMLVGRAHERRGERDIAAPLIERALATREVRLSLLQTVEGLPEATANIRAQIGNRDTAGAERSAEALMRQYPGSSDVLALAGDTALAQLQPATALARYTQSASVRRPWLLTRKIIMATRALGDDKAADTLLVRAVLGEPRNTEALLMLAQRRAEEQDWERVAALSNLVFVLGAGNDPRVLDLQAKAAEALGREDQAAQWDLTAEAVRPGRFVRKN